MAIEADIITVNPGVGRESILASPDQILRLLVQEGAGLMVSVFYLVGGICPGTRTTWLISFTVPMRRGGPKVPAPWET